MARLLHSVVHYNTYGRYVLSGHFSEIEAALLEIFNTQIFEVLANEGDGYRKKFNTNLEFVDLL